MNKSCLILSILVLSVLPMNAGTPLVLLHTNDTHSQLEPYETAEAKAAWLKSVKKCNVVICLSHLGLDNKGEAPDDIRLAEKTKSIDVIIGGHSHTFMRNHTKQVNAVGDTVIINQVGKGGIYVGRIDLDVD